MSKPLQPNQTPFPNSPIDDPYRYTSFLAGKGTYLEPVEGQLDVSTVDELAAVKQIGMPELTPQGPITDLAWLRARFPFIQIMPLFTQFTSVFLPTANLADELIFPNGTTLVRFFGNNDYFLSISARAIIPTAALSPTAASGGNTENREKVVYRPEGVFWYVGGLKAVSCVAPNNNTYVSAACFITNQRPTRV